MNTRKWLCLALSCLMLVAPVLGLAEDSGLAAFLNGRELVFTYSVDTSEDSPMGETHNAGRTRIGCLDSGAPYTVMEKMDESLSAAVEQLFAMAFADTSLFVHTETDEVGVLEIDFAQLDALVANVQAYLNHLAEKDPEFAEMMAQLELAFAEMAEGFSAAMLAEETPVEDIYDMLDISLAELGFTGVGDAVRGWAEEHLVSEYYEGEIISVLGVETNTANVFALTPERIGALWDAIAPVLNEQDDAWRNFFMIANAENPAGSMSQEEIDEMLSVIHMLLGLKGSDIATLLPSDMVLRVNECLDANGDTACIMLEGYLPLDEATALAVYFEMADDPLRLCFYFRPDNNTEFTLTAAATPWETSETEGIVTKTGAFDVNLYAESYGETNLDMDMNFYLSTDVSNEAASVYASADIYNNMGSREGIHLDLYSSLSPIGETGISAYFSTELRASDARETLGSMELSGLVDIALNDEGTDFDDCSANIEWTLCENDVETTLMTIQANGELVEPQGEAFDPASVPSVNPAEMTQDAFIEWMDSLMADS